MNLLNLTLLAPLALVGLAALAVPIYLHMRHKPRAEIFSFPAIDFLLKAQKKKKRRLRVEQLVLMLMRLAVILLLVFLFAKPFIEERDGSSASVAGQPLIIILDDTLSMLSGPANAPYFEEARLRINTTLNQRGAAPTRLLTSSNPSKFIDLETADALRSVLPQLKCTTIHYTLDQAYNDALNLVAKEGWNAATIQIYTDGSRTAWQQLPDQKPDSVEVIYTAMRDQETFQNVGILDASQSPGNRNAIEVSLQNSSNQNREITLALDGAGMAPIRNPMRVDGGRNASHYFALGDEVPAQLDITIDDDDYRFDNHLVLVPQANRLIRVLIVDGDTNPEPVNSESFFVKNALGFEESESYGYQFEVVTPVGLREEKLNDFDVIFVLNVDLPAAGVLKKALLQGKGVFIGMGERMDMTTWNAFLEPYDLQMYETKVMPAPAALTLRQSDHPFLQPLEAITWRSYLQNVGVSKFRIVSQTNSSADIPISLGDGSPLLISKELDMGRLMIWTSSMDVDWNNFPLEYGFLPFVRQTTAWLAARESSSSFQRLTINQVMQSDIIDSLNLKHTPPAFQGLDHLGPKPGVYTRAVGTRTEYILARLDPAEVDLRGIEENLSDDAEREALDKIGFRSYARTDLAPDIQWLLFALILIETLVAARYTLSWGSR